MIYTCDTASFYDGYVGELHIFGCRSEIDRRKWLAWTDDSIKSLSAMTRGVMDDFGTLVETLRD